MRITGGAFRGRPVRVPKDARVRPTSDRLRETWFNLLGGVVDGARVLDLFAGSGVLGLEALSRGARDVVFVERARVALAAIADNVAALDVDDRCTIRRADAMRFARGLDAGAFDLALADPPYGRGLAADLVTLFLERPFASILGVEHPVRETMPGGTTRTYGDTAITRCDADS